MRRARILAFGGIALLAVAASIALGQAPLVPPVGFVSPASVDLKPAPIPSAWVLEGTPTALAREIARSPDDSTTVYLWQTSAGRFNWFYDSDEIVTILDGEVFVKESPEGPESRLGPHDVAFFPRGAATTWRVPDHLRKIATLKRPLPGPIAGLVRFAQMAKALIKPTAAFAAD